MIRIQMEFENIKQVQEFLGNLNNVPAVNAVVSPKKEHKIGATTSYTIEDNALNGLKVQNNELSPESVSAPDFAAVKQAVLALSQAKNSDTARAVLRKFNDKNGKPCEKVTAVAESDYPALLMAVKAAM